MRYSKRERNLAVAAVAMGVLAATLLVLRLLDGPAAESGSKRRAAEHRQTGTSAASPGSGQASLKPLLRAEYSVRHQWDGGFDADVTVTNIGSEPISGWTVILRLPADVTVTHVWAADFIQTGGIVSLRSQPWNTYLGPGAVTSLGFQATGKPGAPSSCTVNGSPC
jgi:cellulase/cellobiase CelA1